MKAIILLTVILVISINSCFAQNNKRKNQSNRNKSSAKEVRLDKKYPTVYISFDHYGETDPYFIGESRERVWLRLQNNTKWRVFVTPTFSIDKNEVGLCYKVEREVDDIETKIPLGYGQGFHRNCSMNLPVDSGKSVLFSIPREHLAENLSIFVEVSYFWENYEIPENSPSKPKSFAVFNSSDLPK